VEARVEDPHGVASLNVGLTPAAAAAVSVGLGRAPVYACVGTRPLSHRLAQC
jgi:hypothetical protein